MVSEGLMTQLGADGVTSVGISTLLLCDVWGRSGSSGPTDTVKGAVRLHHSLSFTGLA